MIDINNFHVDEVRSLRDKDPEDRVFLAISQKCDITIVYTNRQFIQLMKEFRGLASFLLNKGDDLIFFSGLCPTWCLRKTSTGELEIEFSPPSGGMYARFHMHVEELLALEKKLSREYKTLSS